MDSRPFQFNLPASSRLPAQTYVYWASALWLLQQGEERTSLLALATELETTMCRALFARVCKAKLEWVGMQGRHPVEVISSGSYLMNEANPGLWTGLRHDPSPGMWLCRMIDINGQESVVAALKGAYLVGAPWEDLPGLLEDVREEVAELQQARKPNWAAIAMHCERFIQAGYMDDPEVQQYLFGLWSHTAFRDHWSTILKRHQLKQT